MRIAFALALFVIAPACCRAELPAPGSAYHLLFATTNQYRTTSSPALPPLTVRFGNIAGADYQVTNDAYSAGLPGTYTWDGISPIYRSILSINGSNARDRLSVAGPVYNTHGAQLATSHADLFDGNLAAPVGYDEYGQAIAADDDPGVWSGSTSLGQWNGGSCGTWNNNIGSGRLGNESDSSAIWADSGASRSCNQSARLYALSPALVAPLWGDYDGSGTVDGGDLLVLGGQPSTAQFQAARAFTSTAPPSEANVVSAADLAVWQQYFGQSLPPATAVPEPAALLLSVAALAASHWTGRLPSRSFRKRS